jgi:hypothetical protein
MKLRALACYRSEMKRVGKTWRKFYDSITKIYGLVAGVDRAEGFISHKFTY